MSFWTTILSWFGKSTTTNSWSVNSLATNVQTLVAMLQPLVAEVLVLTKTTPSVTTAINGTLTQIELASVSIAAATSQVGVQPLVASLELLVNQLITQVKAVPGLPANVLNELTLTQALLPVIEALV
jgi:hypothetical protein